MNLNSTVRILIIFLLLQLVFISCTEEENPVQQQNTTYNGTYGTVAGKFVAANGEGLAGVVVSIVSSYTNLTTVTTNASGEYTHPNVPVGDQTIKGTKGNFSATVNVTVTEGQTTNAPVVTLQPLGKLGFVYGIFDEIQSIIRELGYLPDSLTTDDLKNPSKVNFTNYSGIFLNCGMDQLDDPVLINNLLTFVRAGGLIYASDWASFYVEKMFPGKISFLLEGDSQEITATIVDEMTINNIGKTNILINYDLGVWAEIMTVNNEFVVLIRGDYFSSGILKTNMPLAVYKTEGQGLVVYTTFHNEVNVTEDMKLLLEEFIFF
jgi:hypothetical protein